MDEIKAKLQTIQTIKMLISEYEEKIKKSKSDLSKVFYENLLEDSKIELFDLQDE